MLSPPLGEFYELVSKRLSCMSELIFSIRSFCDYPNCSEFIEAIGEYLGIGFTDTFTDISIARSSGVYRLQYKNNPLFPEESEQSLCMRTGTLRFSYHVDMVYKFFLKAKNLHSYEKSLVSKYFIL